MLAVFMMELLAVTVPPWRVAVHDWTLGVSVVPPFMAAIVAALPPVALPVSVQRGSFYALVQSPPRWAACGLVLLWPPMESPFDVMGMVVMPFVAVLVYDALLWLFLSIACKPLVVL